MGSRHVRMVHVEATGQSWSRRARRSREPEDARAHEDFRRARDGDNSHSFADNLNDNPKYIIATLIATSHKNMSMFGDLAQTPLLKLNTESCVPYHRFRGHCRRPSINSQFTHTSRRARRLKKLEGITGRPVCVPCASRLPPGPAPPGSPRSLFTAVPVHVGPVRACVLSVVEICCS